MSIDTPTQETETAQPTGINDPNLSFTDFEKLRRGQTLPEAKSAPVEKTEKKAPENSEDSEAESKEELTDESEDEAGDESDAPKDEAKDKVREEPKKKSGWQKRIDKLNGRVTTAQQEAEYWKSVALKSPTESKSEKVETKQAAKSDAESKPSPDAYDTHQEYVEALASWTYKEGRKAEREEEKKLKLQTEHDNLFKSHTDRLKSFADKTDDFEETIANLDDVPRSAVVEQIILSSDNGPELLYALAKNPKEAKRICSLEPIAAARELGKLESKLSSNKSEESKPEPKKTTSAPKPISTVGKGQAKVSKSLNDPDLSFEDYVRLRRDDMKRKNA